jgi:hypothetical protein
LEGSETCNGEPVADASFHFVNCSGNYVLRVKAISSGRYAPIHQLFIRSESTVVANFGGSGLLVFTAIEFRCDCRRYYGRNFCNKNYLEKNRRLKKNVRALH